MDLYDLEDMLGGGYGYGGYGGLDSMASSGVGIAVVTILCIIAFIVLCVLCYIFFLGKNASKRNSKLGQFFNFDHYYIKKFLLIIYMVLAVGVAVFGVYIFLSLIVTSGVVGFFAGLITGAIAILLGELLLRISYEASLIFVDMALDTKRIRKHLVGQSPEEIEAEQREAAIAEEERIRHEAAEAARAAAAAAAAQRAEEARRAAEAQRAAEEQARQQQAQMQQQAQQGYGTPVAPTAGAAGMAGAAATDAWYCPSCGRQNTGRFCAGCGSPRG